MNDRNNFSDIIRHVAAYLVLFSHHFALSGYAEPHLMHWDTLGFVAVVIFFSISGYFMPASFINAGNFISYISKRCYRIFPGLFVCAFFMCYVIGPFFSTSSIIDYLLDPHILKTDISYGVYIYAFPVQQIVINCVTQNFWIGMYYSAIITTVLAVFSYLCVEKSFSYTNIKSKNIKKNILLKIISVRKKVILQLNIAK